MTWTSETSLARVPAGEGREALPRAWERPEWEGYHPLRELDEREQEAVRRDVDAIMASAREVDASPVYQGARKLANRKHDRVLAEAFERADAGRWRAHLVHRIADELPDCVLGHTSREGRRPPTPEWASPSYGTITGSDGLD